MPNHRGRVWTVCLNCKKRFSLNNAEYIKRSQATNLPGLFCVKACWDEYREKTKSCEGMKNRILAINKKAAQLESIKLMVRGES